MNEFLAWLRYVVFDGDLGYLVLEKNQMVIDMQKKREA